MNQEIQRIMNTPASERTAEDFTIIAKFMREERKRLIANGVDKKKLSISPIGQKKEWIEEYDKIKLVLKPHCYSLRNMFDTLFKSTITDEKPKGQQYIHLHISKDDFIYDLVLQNPKAKKEKKENHSEEIKELEKEVSETLNEM